MSDSPRIAITTVSQFMRTPLSFRAERSISRCNMNDGSVVERSLLSDSDYASIVWPSSASCFYRRESARCKSAEHVLKILRNRMGHGHAGILGILGMLFHGRSSRRRVTPRVAELACRHLHMGYPHQYVEESIYFATFSILLALVARILLVRPIAPELPQPCLPVRWHRATEHLPTTQTGEKHPQNPQKYQPMVFVQVFGDFEDVFRGHGSP